MLKAASVDNIQGSFKFGGAVGAQNKLAASLQKKLLKVDTHKRRDSVESQSSHMPVSSSRSRSRHKKKNPKIFGETKQISFQDIFYKRIMGATPAEAETPMSSRSN